MTIYELLTAFTAPTATWAALVALFRCKRAVRDANRALTIAQKALDESASINAPLLIFSCEMSIEREFASILVRIFNSGNDPTEIVTGHVRLKEDNNPVAERTRDLSNRKLQGRREHLADFRLRRSDSGYNESPPIEVQCEATYTREGQENAQAYECFTLDGQGTFTRKIRRVNAIATSASV